MMAAFQHPNQGVIIEEVPDGADEQDYEWIEEEIEVEYVHPLRAAMDKAVSVIRKPFDWASNAYAHTIDLLYSPKVSHWHWKLSVGMRYTLYFGWILATNAIILIAPIYFSHMHKGKKRSQRAQIQHAIREYARCEMELEALKHDLAIRARVEVEDIATMVRERAMLVETAAEMWRDYQVTDLRSDQRCVPSSVPAHVFRADMLEKLQNTYDWKMLRRNIADVLLHHDIRTIHKQMTIQSEWQYAFYDTPIGRMMHGDAIPLRRLPRTLQLLAEPRHQLYSELLQQTCLDDIDRYRDEALQRYRKVSNVILGQYDDGRAQEFLRSWRRAERQDFYDLAQTREKVRLMMLRRHNIPVMWEMPMLQKHMFGTEEMLDEYRKTHGQTKADRGSPHSVTPFSDLDYHYNSTEVWNARDPLQEAVYNRMIVGVPAEVRFGDEHIPFQAPAAVREEMQARNRAEAERAGTGAIPPPTAVVP
jgi:hypothetical protein